MLQGSFPQKADEIAIDRMHADNVGIKVGDTVTVSGETYKAVSYTHLDVYKRQHISELANNPCLFLRNPNVDFSRKRKIDFKTFIGIIMNSG